MKTDAFVLRHIGPRKDDVHEMIKTIGLNSVEELIEKRFPLI